MLCVLFTSVSVLLMSTYIICFRGEVRRYNYLLLSRVMSKMELSLLIQYRRPRDGLGTLIATGTMKKIYILVYNFTDQTDAFTGEATLSTLTSLLKGVYYKRKEFAS